MVSQPSRPAGAALQCTHRRSHPCAARHVRKWSSCSHRTQPISVEHLLVRPLTAHLWQTPQSGSCTGSRTKSVESSGSHLSVRAAIRVPLLPRSRNTNYGKAGGRWRGVPLSPPWWGRRYGKWSVRLCLFLCFNLFRPRSLSACVLLSIGLGSTSITTCNTLIPRTATSLVVTVAVWAYGHSWGEGRSCYGSCRPKSVGGFNPILLT